MRIEFAPLTLLFGPKNARKSMIVQALRYARAVLERNNCDAGPRALGLAVATAQRWPTDLGTAVEKAVQKCWWITPISNEKISWRPWLGIRGSCPFVPTGLTRKVAE